MYSEQAIETPVLAEMRQKSAASNEKEAVALRGGDKRGSQRTEDQAEREEVTSCPLASLV